MKLKNLVLTALIACSPFATTSWADITLNPSATNGIPQALDPATGSFTTNNSQVAYTSLLDINSAPGAGGPVTFSESGNFQILNFNPQPNSTSNVTNTYNVYSTFKVQGAGIWVGNAFIVGSSGLSLSANVYGSPGCTTSGVNGGACGSSSGLIFSAPTTGNAGTLAQYGIVQGVLDFALGTANIISDPTNFATAIVSGGTSGSATATILALLGFTPAAGTSGIGGFWKLPDPFNIDIGAQAGGNTVNTSFNVASGVTHVLTSNVNGINQGGGSLNYTVPEPTTIALLGLGLFGMGVASRRRKS